MTSQCSGTTSRKRLLEVLTVLAAVVAYTQAAPLVYEKAYEAFLYSAIRREIIIRGAVGITQDATASAVSTSTSPITAALNHAAKVLVVIGISTAATSVDSVTVGGVAATLLTSITRCYVYYIFRSAAGNETISVSWTNSANSRLAFTAVSYTGTVTSAPFFEGTATNNGSGASPQTVAKIITAGSTGRRILQAVAGTTPLDTSNDTVLVAPGGSQTEIIEVDGAATLVRAGASSELNYRDTASSVTMTSTASDSFDTITWGTVVTAILPETADFTFANSQLV